MKTWSFIGSQTVITLPAAYRERDNTLGTEGDINCNFEKENVRELDYQICLDLLTVASCERKHTRESVWWVTTLDNYATSERRELSTPFRVWQSCFTYLCGAEVEVHEKEMEVLGEVPSMFRHFLLEEAKHSDE